MDHSRFVQAVKEVSLGELDYFTDEVIRRWLDDNAWVEDLNSRCQWCEHMEKIKSGFSEKQCRRNVESGGSCYRETLKEIFIPFLRNALKGNYPSSESLAVVVHKKGPIWDGIGDMKLAGIIHHELGGTYMKMATESVKKILI